MELEALIFEAIKLWTLLLITNTQLLSKRDFPKRVIDVAGNNAQNFSHEATVNLVKECIFYKISKVYLGVCKK